MDWLAPTVFLWKFVFPPTSPSVSLSLFATRHDEPRTRQRMSEMTSSPRVRPIMSLRFLPTRLSFSFHPSFLRAQVFFSLDYFYRIMLTRGAMAKHEFSKREPRSRKWIFCRAGCKRDSGFFFLRTKKIVANCMLLYRLFSLLDLKDFGYFFFDILFNYLIEEVKIVSLINLQFNVEFSK